jgi:hypothetical protein
VSGTFAFEPASTKNLIASVKPFYVAFVTGLKDLEAFKSTPTYKI